MSGLKISVLSLVAIGALCGSSSALARAPEQMLSERVRYIGLDLTTREGLALLDRRIERAAQRVCEPVQAFTLGEKAAVRTCVAKARRDAAVQRDQAIARAQRRLGSDIAFNGSR